MKITKTLLLTLVAVSALSASAKAGFAIVDGRQVYFGQSGHWAIEYPSDSDEDQILIYRGEGDRWSFDQGEDDDQ